MRAFILFLVCLFTALTGWTPGSWAQSSPPLSTPGLLLSGMSWGYRDRLESLLPYQQALLPLGVTSFSSYWVEQGQAHRLGVGEVLCLPSHRGDYEQLLQEFYELRYLNGHWRSLFTRRYQAEPTTLFERQGMPPPPNFSYFGGIYPLNDTNRPEHVVIHKNFDPLRILEGQSPPQPVTACFFYVLATRPGFVGDTLASYYLGQAHPSGAYLLAFQQRDEQSRRRWRGHARTDQQWEYDPATRRLTSFRTDGGTARNWTRTYGPGQDFVEQLEVTHLRGEHGGGVIIQSAYERHHTCKAGQAVDQYTVHLPNPESLSFPEETVTYTIVMDFQ